MTPLSLRLEFAETAARGLSTMTELCARSGVSRRVGHKWLARDAAEDAGGGPGLLGRFDERDLRIHGAQNRNKLPRRP